MGELTQRRWAVMSERGREATRIEYAEAMRIVRDLQTRGASGLCIISEEAARHLPPAPASEESPAAPVPEISNR